MKKICNYRLHINTEYLRAIGAPFDYQSSPKYVGANLFTRSPSPRGANYILEFDAWDFGRGPSYGGAIYKIGICPALYYSFEWLLLIKLKIFIFINRF